MRKATVGTVGFPWVYDAPLELQNTSAQVTVHCLVDASIVECFFSNQPVASALLPYDAEDVVPDVGSAYRRAITARSYYSQSSSQHLGLFAVAGAADVVSVDAWALEPTDL